METQSNDTQQQVEEVSPEQEVPFGQLPTEQLIELMAQARLVNAPDVRIIESPARDSKFTEVWCLDSPGQGGACHLYAVVNKETHKVTSLITFQNGPISEVGGVNGSFNEDLLAIVHDRLDHFSKGDYSTRENALAKTDVESALLRLHQRTLDRERRAVINTNEK